METANTKGRRLTVRKDGVPCYDIVYRSSFEDLGQELAALGYTGRQICIVTDSNVGPLYGEEVRGALADICRQVPVCVLPAGESNKNLAQVERICRFLVEHGIDRSGLILALGGGVVGDVAGFAASAYMRGIDFIQIPTSLLAQADSSIGGKTGVDIAMYKNIAGAFYMPRLVYANVSVLASLDQRQFSSGFAEVMKHGLIRDEAYYVWLLENMYEILDRDPETLQSMLYRSNEIKKEIVERDPLEKGDRMLLNMGHTIGHAIEKYSGLGLAHGECVALGCVAAAYISWKRDMISKDEYYEIRDMFVPFGLPITADDLEEETILKLTRSDKKVRNGVLRFVLLRGIGQAVIDETVSDEEILAAIHEIHYVEDGE